MQTGFEEWLNSHRFSAETYRLFAESFKCLENRAASAALLFAYVGFATIIRERILDANAPSGIPPKLWQTITADVKSDDNWDKNVYESLVRQTPAPIFLINEDLRGQIAYWKNRRNDCAHSKGNAIDIAHVHAFFYFLRSNLSKIVVNGSKDSLLVKLKTHFDPSYTKPGSSIDYLVNEVASAIASEELEHFFETVISEMKQNDTDWLSTSINTKYTNPINLISRCLEISPKHVQEKCRKVITKHPDLLLEFIRTHPEQVNILSSRPDLVRKLWHKDLFKDQIEDLPVFLSLLRESLIPEIEIEESFSLLISKNIKFSPTNAEDEVLKASGFYDFVESKIIGGLLNTYESANRAKFIVAKYLTLKPIKREVAKSIFEGFNHEIYPWHLATVLNKLFSELPAKKLEYLNHVDGEEIDIPSKLEALAKTENQDI